MDYRFQVGDMVRVIGIKLSCSSDLFLDKVGTIMYINKTGHGDVFARHAYAVAFDDLPDRAGHTCGLQINGDTVFELDGQRGNWFKDADLELACQPVALTIDLDLL